MAGTHRTVNQLAWAVGTHAMCPCYAKWCPIHGIKPTAKHSHGKLRLLTKAFQRAPLPYINLSMYWITLKQFIAAAGPRQNSTVNALAHHIKQAQQSKSEMWYVISYSSRQAEGGE